jgi:hypothetical protein
MQRPDPLQALRQPRADQPPPCLIDDLHVVVIFSPVIPDEQQPASLLPVKHHSPAATREPPAH